MEFMDRTFIVTGGASGLGRATTEALLNKGARVVVADLTDTPPEGTELVKTDVTNADDVAHLVEIAAGDSAKPLTGVVNCAGIAIAEKTVGKNGAHDLDRFAKVIQINLIGTFNVIRLAAEAMAKNDPISEDGERGAIVNTASVAAFDGQIGQAAYAASKGGVASLTLPLARDLSRNGIRVNTIAPGIFWTPMMAGLPEDAQESLNKQVPFPSRLGRPEEYAELALDLIHHSYINGETIRLDGGIRMAPK